MSFPDSVLCFLLFAIVLVRKCYWKVRTSLTTHSQTFCKILNADMPTLRTTQVNQ